MLNVKLLFLFYSLYMLQLSATLKMKASSLEKEAWGCLSLFKQVQKPPVFGIFLFNELPEFEEEEGPPSKKIYLVDEPSTGSDPFDPKLPTTPSSRIEIAFPINEGSLHDSGISQEFLPIQEQFPSEKQFISVVFNVNIVLRVEPMFAHILIKSM